MNREQLARRIAQYALGLVSMALGIVLLRRANLGIDPVTTIPVALSGITRFSLGNTTIALHMLCVVGQILLVRRVTLKSILTFFVGFVFGYIIDGLLLLIPDVGSLPLRIALMLCGFACCGLGTAVIVGTDLMLPAPDELNHTISQVFGKKLPNVKIVSDAVYAVLAVTIDLSFTGRVSSVGVGTLLAVLLIGKFIGWFTAWFPGIVMAPFWPQTQRS